MPINRQLVQWSRTIHVYLSIALLFIMVFFSVTGITLNNATNMSGEPRVTTSTLDELPELPRGENNEIIESNEFKNFIRQEFGISLSHADLSYEDEFLIIDYQAPGTATLIEIDQGFNEAFIEKTNFGLIAVLNDIHKGRHVDTIISWLIDISAVILIIFSIAGFILLLPNQRRFKKVFSYTTVSLIVLSLGYYIGSAF